MYTAQWCFYRPLVYHFRQYHISSSSTPTKFCWKRFWIMSLRSGLTHWANARADWTAYSDFKLDGQWQLPLLSMLQLLFSELRMFPLVEVVESHRPILRSAILLSGVLSFVGVLIPVVGVSGLLFSLSTRLTFSLNATYSLSA